MSADKLNEAFRFINPFRDPVKNLTANKQSSESAFKLDSAFIGGLIDRLEEVLNRMNHWSVVTLSDAGLNREAIPHQKHLEMLIEGAFWASLEREEGRHQKFILYYGECLAQEYEIRFKQTIPFNVKSLAKIGAAASEQPFGVAVYPSGGELKIWGLTVSKGLTITVIDPGKLIVKFFYQNVAAISGDQTLLLRNSMVFTASFFWRKFAQGGEVQYIPWRDQRIVAISHVLETMRNLGHGGTLVILKDKKQANAIQGIEYESAQPSTALSNTHARDSKPEEFVLFNNQPYRDNLARFVAALATVDGATLLTYDLEILGFGAMFEWNPADSPKTLICLLDPLDHDDYLKTISLDRLGHSRHQSAAQFVAKNHDALAFVVSQDGNITAFVWEELNDENPFSSLVAYSRLELTM
jgi:hypothetical protein